MKDSKKIISRKGFLRTSALGIAGLFVLPRTGNSVSYQEKRDIKIGFIGLGQQAMSLLNGFMQVPGVEIVAGCDVYGIKRKRFEKRVLAFNVKSGITSKPELFEKYQDLLKRTDITAVVIAVPDHSHAMVAIAACKAGKDIYLEKPMTFTIREGQELRKTVRETKRILALGSQQRSDPNFQHAVNLVQTGALGKIIKVNAYVGAPPTPYNLPAEPVPEDLNWDLWLGPLTKDINYNSQLDPPIKLDPEEDEKIWGAWRWYKEMGGGYTTDWGAHMFDIVQWGLGMDRNGPVEASPIADGSDYMSFTYANGVVMTSEPWNEKRTKGVKFWGEKGWIEVARGYFNASDKKFFAEKKDPASGPYETKVPHQANFIDCVRSRKDPVVPVEIGHSSCTVCNLGNIACDLKRTVRWDPKKEIFINDKDNAATKLMQYTYRTPWRLA